jgi:chitinase
MKTKLIILLFFVLFNNLNAYILDNFEDSEFTVNNRGGGWYEFADPATSSVSRTIITGDVPSGGGTYSGRISGNVIGGSGSWASIGAGTNLNSGATPENLNLTSGIRLYMKGNYGTGTNVTFRIQIVSTNITDYSYWYFAWTPQANWTYITIPWTSFGSPGWGQGNGMTLTQILSQVQAIQFSIADTTGGAVNNTGNNWYVDSIEIYGESTVTFTPTNTPYAGTPTNTPTVTPTTEKCRRFLAYYPYWVSTYRADKIPYNKLTHICHAFVQPQANGSLVAPSGYLEPALITYAHNAGVKVLVSIGGADEVARQNFATIAASASLRTAFANAVESFCRTYGYDGADIDWEFPQNATDRTNQNLLIQAVRDKFNSSSAPAPSWEITMAVSPGNWYGQWNDYSYLNNVISFYNLMTYDYHGEWSAHSGHNSPLYRGTDPLDGENIDWSNNYMTVTRGVPASKMNLGIPFYGYRFPNSESLYDSFVSGAYQMNYNIITPLIGSGWTYNWDSGSIVPYLTYDSGAGLISYDNPQSVIEKVNYALSVKGYGGIFMWEITADYSAGSQPLLDAMWNSYAAFCGLTTPVQTQTRTPTRTNTTIITSTFTRTQTRTETPTYSRTATPTNTQVITNTFTATPTRTNTQTITNTPIFTNTFTGTYTRTSTVTSTSTNSPSPTGTPTGTYTTTRANTPTYTRTITVTNIPTNSATPSFTQTATPSVTLTLTLTRTVTNTPSVSSSPTRTITQTHSVSPTITQTSTGTPPSPSNTLIPSPSYTSTVSSSSTPIVTPSRTVTQTYTYTSTNTNTPSSSYTPTRTSTRTETQTLTYTRTNTPTNTPTISASLTRTITISLTKTVTITWTSTSQPINTHTPTSTRTQIDNRQLKIENLVLYPNPYNPNNQDLKINILITGQLKLIKVKIYTSGFRLIKQITYEGDYAGEETLIIDKRYLNNLANGVCYILIAGINNEGITIHSKPNNLIIFK